ncbi:MAG: glycosyltransferase family 2 protein [Candidatus Sungbacteria bacterium]|nr:glycosyltransferase family 2 protein [Candidatus Sungbacteria bacterium]
MGGIPASVSILTFNSATTLPRALESLKDFDEIIVCDGGSTDGTLAIAEKYGSKVIFQNAKYKNADGTIRDYAGVRNQCLGAAEHDWFFYLDSDEVITPELCDEIRDIIASLPSVLIYEVSFEMELPGRLVRESAALPSYQLRFFNIMTGARFTKEVHEKIVFDRKKYKVGRLKGKWRVIWNEDRVRNYWKRADRYLAMEVRRLGHQTFPEFIGFAFGNILQIGKRASKIAINLLRLPVRSRMPIRLELYSIGYAAKLMYLMAKKGFTPTPKNTSPFKVRMSR